MPVEQVVVVNIACDNPDCPGNDLDARSRDGWIIVQGEVYGHSQVGQFAYCSSACLSAASAAGVEALPSLPSAEPMEATE